MGSVWSGEHIEQRVPVAVKVINVDQARRENYLRAFRNEVRAVAGLDHPGVVMVFDHGEVPAEAERLSGGRMLQGSPYLVMEKASGGALDEAKVAWSWSQAEEVLFGLMDALGHAHARGVVHRDLKPGNVLICTDEDTRPGIKLADFGLSHANEVALRGNSSYSGTPRYMAPEQFNGRWRDYGAWTDLYALGCMAFELVTGTAPFRGDSYAQLRQGHLYADAPGIAPGMAVPNGFEGWVRRLLEKDPRARFRTAADAAWALWKLGPPEDPKALLARLDRKVNNRTVSCTLAFEGLRPTGESATWHFFDDAAPSDPSDNEDEILPSPSEMESAPTLQPAVGTLAPIEVPPMPKDWRRPTERQSMRLIGTGLGLYGLRRVPLVDRIEERDAIWQALGEVRQTRRPQALVFRGAGGVGKSRLVEWMAQRARELGSAHVLRATHSPRPGPQDGLEGMIGRELACVGLGHDDAARRVERRLRSEGVGDDYEWLALTELISPRGASESTDGVVAFSRPSERYVLVRRLLQRLDRPALVWLDDVQWGPDAVAFARLLLESEDCPVLVVMTVREQTDVLEHPACTERELPRLGKHARRELIQELLMLEGDVAAQVEERTGGNPLFAVQLVGDWVQRGILLPGPRGFVLESGAAVDIPDDLHAVWDDRLQALLQPGERRALELAAVLGAAVDEQEWRVALNSARSAFPAGLVERMVDRQLATSTANGWAFSHQLMRESLERSARESGAEGLHAACADMLEALYPADRRGVPSRRGAHLLAAGREEEALDPLLQASEQGLAASEYRVALELLDRRDATVARLRLPDHDPRIGEGQLLRARVLIGQGNPAASELARAAIEGARAHAWIDLVPTALWVGAQAASKRGAVDDTLARACVEESRRVGDRLHEAHGRRLLAVAARSRGDAPEASRLGREAYALFEAARHERGMADALIVVAAGESDSGRIEAAGQLLRRAVTLFERVGSQYGLASAYNNLADLLRKDGDLHGAESGFRSALATFRRVGSPDAIVPLLNLGIVLTLRGEHAPAREHLRASLRMAESGKNRVMEGFAHALSLPSSAALRSWRSWGQHAEGARSLNRSGVFDPDVASALQQAGIEAARQERWEQAREALELSREQWQGLGRDWELERVDKALEAIG